MKKLFLILACVAMSVLAKGQDNQLVWANGRLLYGTPVESIDSLTYDEMEDVDTLHLLLPRTLVKVVHDTVYIHDTIYVETDCGGEDDTPSASMGVFSVGEGKQVTFSKGNLQYHPANNEWRLAPSQLDYIGEANSNCSATYNGWLDLFGWGTGDNPTNSSTDNNDYQIYVDWGKNQIGNEIPNTWRTMTSDEWYYLRFARANADALCGIACVNGVTGIIFMPDDWIAQEGLRFKSGFSLKYSIDAYAQYQTITLEKWESLEQSGAIFLPAAGFCDGMEVTYTQYYGNYWSSTELDDNNAYYILFHSGEARMGNYGHYIRRSVRLVKDL